MKRFIAAALVLLAAFAAATAQTVDAEAEIKRLLSEGGRAYREGRYVEAQRSFERVRALDPAHKLAPLFIARAAQQQYKPGVETPENVQKAQEAVEAYKLVLASEYAEPKHKEDAYDAVAYLYRQMRDEGAEEQWLLQRANDSAAAPEKRSDAYTILASKQWDCSYNVTEQKENKETVDRGAEGVVVHYKRPTDQAAFEKMQSCINEGLQLVEQAIALNKDSASAWSYKTNLLREMAKMAEMNGDPAGKAEYTRQADEAGKERRRLHALASEKKAHTDGARGEQSTDAAAARADEAVPAPEQKPVMSSVPAVEPPSQPRPSPVRRVSPVAGAGPNERVVKGGILNGKAVSKPAPVYPETAKAARASGSVMVQVRIDEEGKVTEAVAVSGHPLLRASAVEAVRQWRFTPTRLSGQPVKVEGRVVVNFIPQ